MQKASHDYLLAFDLGTTGNKVVLIDVDAAVVVDSETSRYPTSSGLGGKVEQSPDDWWASTVHGCRAIAERCPEAVKNVAAIGCTGMMNGIVAVDSAGHAIRPSIIHADTRATGQSTRLAEIAGASKIWQSTHNRPDCRLSLYKAMWMAENEPETLAAATSIVQSKDYLVGRLTGCVGMTDPSDASLTGAFDVGKRQWVRELWSEAGLPERLLPTVAPSTEVIGEVTNQAARELGIRAGIPVVAGGGDGPCATAGSGVGLGEAYHYLGSSSWIGLSSDGPIADDRLSHYCSLDGGVTVFGTVQAAGTSLEWFLAAFGVPDTSPQPSPWKGEGVFSPAANNRGVNGAAGLDDEAVDVAPGADGLFFLPYLQGERAPLWDAAARGAFIGITPAHNWASMYRAVLEGVGYALRSILDVYAVNGHLLPELRQLGGGARSPVWRSILAAIFERRLLSVSGVSSATCLGAAMAAGVGVGIWPSIREAGVALTSVDAVTEPDPKLMDEYKPRMDFYRTLYPALQDRFRVLAAMECKEA